MASVTQQIPLFPVFESLEAVYADAKAQLPITTENQLNNILSVHQNTLLDLIAKQKEE